MPAGERPAVPLPPSAPPSSLPALDEHALEEAWRIQRPGNPLRPRRRAHGRFRFDAPAGEYAVTYVNLDRHACYAEVFGDAREIPPSAADRRLFRLRAARPLRVLALDRARVQKAFALDLNVCSSLDYRRTQAWSLAFHTWCPEADGIRYLGRHAVEDLNLCLFLDRCGDALEAREEGSLAALRRDGLVAAHRYHLAPRLFFWSES